MTEPPAFGFAGYRTVPPPPRGFWRVSSWTPAFDPPPPPPALDAPPDEDDAGRYDDPGGRFRTLYCATEPEGAIGERLGDFVFNSAAVVRIEVFLESEPESGFDEDYHHPLSSADIKAFGWKLAHAPALDARLIDVDHWRTYLAAAPRALPALGRYGIERFDRQTVPVRRRDQTPSALHLLPGVAAADRHRRLLQIPEGCPHRLSVAGHELTRDVLWRDGEQDAERLRRGEREIERGDLRVRRSRTQPRRRVTRIVAGDQRAELPGAHPPLEAESLRARARPLTGGLAAAGVVVVLALGYLLLVVAVLTQRDLVNREHP